MNRIKNMPMKNIQAYIKDQGYLEIVKSKNLVYKHEKSITNKAASYTLFASLILIHFIDYPYLIFPNEVGNPTHELSSYTK
jgi:hypothetical protein